MACNYKSAFSIIYEKHFSCNLVNYFIDSVSSCVISVKMLHLCSLVMRLPKIPSFSGGFSSLSNW